MKDDEKSAANGAKRPDDDDDDDDGWKVATGWWQHYTRSLFCNFCIKSDLLRTGKRRKKRKDQAASGVADKKAFAENDTWD